MTDEENTQLRKEIARLKAEIEQLRNASSPPQPSPGATPL
jgi:hypothetical protein